MTGLEIDLELSESGQSGVIRVQRIEVPEAGLDLKESIIECGRVQVTQRWLRCDDAYLAAEFPVLGRQVVAGHFHYEREPGVLHFALPQIALAGGTVGVSGQSGESGSFARFDGTSLALPDVLGLAAKAGIDSGGLTASGNVDARGSVNTDAAGTISLQLDADLGNASVSNDAGTIAGEAVGGSISMQAEYGDGTWTFDIDASADSGEAYIEPVYANLSEQPLRIKFDGARTTDFTTFDVARFELEQGTQASLNGSARLRAPSGEQPLLLESATVAIHNTAVTFLYKNLLQIPLAGTAVGDLDTAGEVSGTVTISDNAPQSAQLELTDVTLDDRQRRFAVYGLAGSLHWPGPDGVPGDTPSSELSWASGDVQGILIDGTTARFSLGGDDLVLRDLLTVPTMGGALRINRLEVHNYGADDARGLLDAELEPVQLGQLTGAFGWPAFSGSLSGRLPLLTYEGNAMTVGGRLTARAFDGDIELANLRIAQPFGRVPRLSADLAFSNLDLERLTSTFSFGLIQGRLSGEVAGLEMVAWRAVAMDARLYTPPGDRTPHRISQRAVENLASVGGGGAGAVLSTGFLKFFEVFAYDRIGLRCVLADGICRMSGAGAAGEGALGRGYYIVKGSGIPRIDVIGYRERVGWDALVRQLSAISRDTTAVVN